MPVLGLNLGKDFGYTAVHTAAGAPAKVFNFLLPFRNQRIDLFLSVLFSFGNGLLDPLSAILLGLIVGLIIFLIDAADRAYWDKQGA